jgi:cation diffusion facilitator CzcD-associated flavoprotein CzcO
VSSANIEDGAGKVVDFDVVVVGAGFSGLYALHKLRDQLGLSVCVYEAGDEVGGTWYWNRYPGARCDIESYSYSYSFSEELQQEWEWSERFAGQPEINRYLNYVADKFDLRRDIRFGMRVVSAIYNEERSVWEIGTEQGTRVCAQFLVAGTGNLSAPKIPDLNGLDDFAGQVYATSRWPREEVDFSGQRVGVIGTGSSGIQVIPEIAQRAAHLTVFQRTPNYVTPLGNGAMDPEFQRYIKQNYGTIRTRSRQHNTGVPYDRVQPSALDAGPEERRRTYEARWREGGFRFLKDAYSDLMVDKDANETAAEFIREKIREQVVDPKVAELLMPYNYPYGAKRPPLETNYFRTFNRDNVTLVDLRSTPLHGIVPSGVETSAMVYELDSIVLATGFDAMTGPLLRMGVCGRGGRSLAQCWENGPRTQLGLMVDGFPNLFTITGPQSPSVLYNMPLAIEDHVNWIADCIRYLRERNIKTIEPSAESVSEWGSHTNEIANSTLLPTGHSWYTGDNIPGKPRSFMIYLGGAPRYRKICDDIAANGYEGFILGRELATG